MNELKKEIREILDKSIVASEVKQVQFRHKKTGEIATQINIFDMGSYEKVGAKVPKPKKPNPATAKFSEMLQYQIDLQKWRQSQY